MGASTYTQEDFRGREDDGSLATATYIAAQNTDWSQDVDVNFRIRFVIQIAGMSSNNRRFELWVSKNSGAYAQITTSSSNVQNVADGNSIGDDATTVQRIGDGTYISGESLGFDTNGTTGNMDMTVSEEGEVEFCLTIVSGDVANDDTLDFRVRLSGGTVLDTYSFTPQVTVVEAGSTQYDRTFTGTIAANELVGTLESQVDYNFAGAVSTLVGDLAHQVDTSFAGGLTSVVGTLQQQVNTGFGGVIATLVGGLVNVSTFIRSFTGDITTLEGDIVLEARTSMSGVVATLIGSLSKQVNHTPSGVISTLVGSLQQQVNTSYSGTIATLTGTLTTVSTFVRTFIGDITTLTGSLTHQANVSMDGAIATLVGTLQQQANAAVAGGLTPVGLLINQVETSMAGSISSIVGALIKQANISVSGLFPRITNTQVVAAMTGLVAHWTLNETVGTTAVETVDSPNQDGTYTAGVLLAEQPSPFPFEGVLSPELDADGNYINIHTATFEATWDAEDLGAEGSMAIWFFGRRWDGGATQRRFMRIQKDASNYIQIYEQPSIQRFAVYAEKSTVGHFVALPDTTLRVWHFVVVSWSETTGKMTIWQNGTQVYDTNVLWTWGSTGLDATRTLLGADDTTTPVSARAALSDAMVFDHPLTQAEVDELFAGPQGLFGQLQKQVNTATSGAISTLVGTLTPVKVFILAAAGNISTLTGSLVKRVSKAFAGLVGQAAASYISVVSNVGPVAHWPLGDVGPTAVEEVDSPALDGTGTGVSWQNAAGPHGLISVPLFDGNDYIDFYSAAVQALGIENLGSLVIWVKATSWASPSVWFNFESSFGLSRTRLEGTLSYARASRTGFPTLTEMRDAGIAGDSDWHMYVITWDSGANEHFGYVDTVLFDTNTTPGATPWHAVETAWHADRTVIGNLTKSGSSGLDGWAAYVQLYDKVLSGSEQATLFATPTVTGAPLTGALTVVRTVFQTLTGSISTLVGTLQKQANHKLLGGLQGDYVAWVAAKAFSVPFAYWVLGDTLADTAVSEYDSPSMDGTYGAAVQIGADVGPWGQHRAPTFALTSVDINSAAFDAAFDPAKGWLSFWFRSASAGQWTDGGYRILVHIGDDRDNYIQITDDTVDNRLEVKWRGNGSESAFVYTVPTPDTEWHHIYCYWDSDFPGSVFGIPIMAGRFDSAVMGSAAFITPWAISTAPDSYLMNSTASGANGYAGSMSHFSIGTPPQNLTQPGIDLYNGQRIAGTLATLRMGIVNAFGYITPLGNSDISRVVAGVIENTVFILNKVRSAFISRKDRGVEIEDKTTSAEVTYKTRSAEIKTKDRSDQA